MQPRISLQWIDAQSFHGIKNSNLYTRIATTYCNPSLSLSLSSSLFVSISFHPSNSTVKTTFIWFLLANQEILVFWLTVSDNIGWRTYRTHRHTSASLKSDRILSSTESQKLTWKQWSLCCQMLTVIMRPGRSYISRKRKLLSSLFVAPEKTKMCENTEFWIILTVLAWFFIEINVQIFILTMWLALQKRLEEEQKSTFPWAHWRKLICFSDAEKNCVVGKTCC